MSVHSGVVTVPNNEKTLIYVASAGVETCMTIVVGPNGAHLGDVNVDSSSFFYDGSEPIVMTRFTGSLYAWISGVSTVVSFLAGDLA